MNQLCFPLQDIIVHQAQPWMSTHPHKSRKFVIWEEMRKHLFNILYIFRKTHYRGPCFPKSYCLCILCLQFLHLSFLIPVTSLWSESALLCLVCIKESVDALLRHLSPLLQNKSTQDNIKYLYYRTWTSTTCCPISIFKDHLRWPQTITTRYHGMFKI